MLRGTETIIAVVLDVLTIFYGMLRGTETIIAVVLDVLTIFYGMLRGTEMIIAVVLDVLTIFYGIFILNVTTDTVQKFVLSFFLDSVQFTVSLSHVLCFYSGYYSPSDRLLLLCISI